MPTPMSTLEKPVIQQKPAREPGNKRNNSGLLLAGTGLLMALALPIGIYPRLMQSSELERLHTKAVEQLPTVSVIKPIPAESVKHMSLPGSVEALVETGIYARRDGYVKNRYSDIGDTVKVGQLLATIETPEVDESAKEAKAMVATSNAAKAQVQANLAKAKSDIETADADLSQARANLIEKQSSESFAVKSFARWNTLSKQGAVSFQETDEKETNLLTARAATKAAEDKVRSCLAQLEAARASLKVQVANLAASDANIDAAVARHNASTSQQGFQKVTAPFSGIITERNIEQGSLITSGSESSKTPLYRLAKIDEVKVFVDVPQYAATGIHVGQQVRINLKEYPNKTFTGVVKRTSVALNATARTLRTEIHIANPQMLLVPGMYADVNFAVARTARTFVVPASSLITRSEGPQLLVATGNKAIYKNVQLGDDLGKQVEILSGLRDSDEVVVNPSDSIVNGAPVKIERH